MLSVKLGIQINIEYFSQLSMLYSGGTYNDIT